MDFVKACFTVMTVHRIRTDCLKAIVDRVDGFHASMMILFNDGPSVKFTVDADRGEMTSDADVTDAQLEAAVALFMKLADDLMR